VRKIKTFFTVLFVLCIIAFPLMLHYKLKFMKKVDKMVLAQLAIVGLVCILALWGY
jgi:hypothetical protein